MRNIKGMVIRNIFAITLTLTIIILILATGLQLVMEQQRAVSDAEKMFERVERMLEQNRQELAEIEADYRQSCIYSARVVAKIMEMDPTALDELEEFLELAKIMELKDIHIFNDRGVVINGSHPHYFGISMHDGEQIGFFLPMLEDKTLELCQDIMPNTAEGTLEQYSAVWTGDGKYIVQVGMDPKDVLKVTAKNELSYIFGLLKVSAGVDWYAVNSATGEIVGSTISEVYGKNISDLGVELETLWNREGGFHAIINGVDSYCVFRLMGDNLVGRVLSATTIYREIPQKITELALVLVAASVVLAFSIGKYLARDVIGGIYAVNDKLRVITSGNLDERVEIKTSQEFYELSHHINDLIKSLLASTDKLSYVLNKTDMRIGVYEYNEQMQSVRFTECIPVLLGLDADRTHQLAHNYKRFQEHIAQLRRHPVPGEDRVYRFDDYTAHYVKIEEVIRGNDVMGIIMDVTEEFIERQRIENERDVDVLTGLYNRRGLEGRLQRMFADPDQLRHGAMLMFDADGLKDINDRYGHEYGDIYLRRIAEAIANFGARRHMAARYGGDEFVLFLYGYDSEQELNEDVRRLEKLQDIMVQLDRNISVPLRFSFGYETTEHGEDYSEILRQADVKMYASKRRRKSVL